MTDAQIGILATAITTGLGLLGRGLFAGARLIREGRLALAAELFELRVMHSAILEQGRRRERRRKRDSTPPHLRSSLPSSDFTEETTDLHELIDLERRNLRPPGERKPRRGTHHDGDD